jgi:hypothetical protein
MGFQFRYWALAVLSCGLGRARDAYGYIENVLQFSDAEPNAAPTMWVVPCAAYVLAESDPERAVELLAWSLAYPAPALGWARRWPLLQRLQRHLREIVDEDVSRAHWEGEALTLESIDAYVRHAFRTTAPPAWMPISRTCSPPASTRSCA